MELLIGALAVGVAATIIGLYIVAASAYRRAHRAEHQLVAAERLAVQCQDEARQARRDLAAAYRCLAKYMPASEIGEAVHFAGAPREDADTIVLPAAIEAKFQTFLNDFEAV